MINFEVWEGKGLPKEALTKDGRPFPRWLEVTLYCMDVPFRASETVNKFIIKFKKALSSLLQRG